MLLGPFGASSGKCTFRAGKETGLTRIFNPASSFNEPTFNGAYSRNNLLII